MSPLILCAFLAWTLGTGAVGGMLTAKSVRSWYLTIKKPTWNPPSWLFAPVWTVLYILMAVSAWIMWRENGFVGVSAAAFSIQMGLNLAWSWLFFGKQRIDLALFEIGLMWIAIAVTILNFWTISPLAGAMLLPYLAWVSFATFLNLTIWRLNQPLLQQR